MVNEIIVQDTNIERRIALLVVKAMNDTMELDGLVPSYLILNCIPGFAAFDSTVPNNKDRMNALEEERY